MRRVEADILRAVRREAWEDQGRCCKYCLAPLGFSESTADHRVPRSKGGTNVKANIVAACGPCNVAKGSMAPAEFKAAIKAPQAGARVGIWLAWSRRRVWLAAYRACRNISYAVGLPNTTPVGQRDKPRAAEMSRHRLPARRYNESFELVSNGIAYSVTLGTYEDGAIGEVFIGMLKAAGTLMDLHARDLAVLISLGLQHGVDLQTMFDATTKTADGNPEGLAGHVLAALLAWQGGSRAP